MALSIAASEYWEGNDGPWSTFVVNIGSQGQQMRVLPASSQSAISVVLDPDGCPPQYPANCSALRGNLFHPDPDDSTWSRQRPLDGEDFFVLTFDSESALPNYTTHDGASTNAEVGYDTLGLNWYGTHLPDQPLPMQVIAAYAAPNPWLGMLGLSGRPSHIWNATTAQPSALQTLQMNGSVPGLYWAYTAGSRHADPPAFGSLTFGGYDAARVNVNSTILVPFGSDSTRDLLLSINSIILTGGQSTTKHALGSPVTAFIDSVVPEIWLPQAVCEVFEAEFSITWDETTSMYLVNDSLHTELLARNPSVTFTLAANSSTSNNTDIKLPYAAFDLTAQFPVAGIQDGATSLNYFPLKRANDSTQYYLGRSFLQYA